MATVYLNRSDTVFAQVSFHPRDSGNSRLQEEARRLGLEPRYVYRVTQVRRGGTNKYKWG